jgi:hypothetical protein
MRVVTHSRPVSRGPWIVGAISFLAVGLGAVALNLPLAGWPALLLGGVILFFATRPAGAPKERIVLDDAGVSDTALGIGPIPWNEIIRGELRPLSKLWVISLEVTDPERWARQLPERQRTLNSFAAELGLSPVLLAVSGLDLPPEEVLRLINDRAAGGRR